MSAKNRDYSSFRPSEAQYQGRKPTPQRITAALDMCMLYGPEVDAALGVEEPTVDEWEAGKKVPTFQQVEALVELTGYPIGFFYQPEMSQVGPMFMCGTQGCRVVVDGKHPEPCPSCRGTGFVR